MKYLSIILSLFLVVSCEKENLVTDTPSSVRVEEAIWDFNSGDTTRGYQFIGFEEEVFEIGFLIQKSTIRLEYSIDYPYYLTAVEGDWRYSVHYLIEGNKDYLVWGEVHFVDNALHVQLFEHGKLSKNRLVFTKRN